MVERIKKGIEKHRRKTKPENNIVAEIAEGNTHIKFNLYAVACHLWLLKTNEQNLQQITKRYFTSMSIIIRYDNQTRHHFEQTGSRSFYYQSKTPRALLLSSPSPARSCKRLQICPSMHGSRQARFILSILLKPFNKFVWTETNMTRQKDINVDWWNDIWICFIFLEILAPICMFWQTTALVSI